MAQFPKIPVTLISNLQLKLLVKSTILFQILQTKMMIFGKPTNICLASNNITDFFQFKSMKCVHSWKLCHMRTKCINLPDTPLHQSRYLWGIERIGTKLTERWNMKHI